MKLVTTYNSPNHYEGRKDGNRKIWKADVIVFHQTGGDTLSPALNWYMNPNAQVSPNWLIDKDGTVYQLVDPENAAWCNGTATSPEEPRFYGYSLSEIVRERKTNANFFSLSAEFVHCGYGNITEAQIIAAVELIQQIIIPYMKKNGVVPKIDRQHIISHSEVSPKTRDPEKLNCPGKKFPFDEIIARANGKNTSAQTSDSASVNFIYQAISQAAIRAGASKSATIFGRVTKYNFYLADQKLDGWFKHTGKNAYSKLVDGGSLFAKVGEYATRTVIATGLNVRSAPTTKSSRITQLKADDVVYVWKGYATEADGYKWSKIIINGGIGYVANKYLR